MRGDLPGNEPDLRWLRSEIGSGLQRLFVLRLSGGPYTVDELVPLAEVWFEAIAEHGIGWTEEFDRVRIAKAFRQLIKASDRWPAPKAFFDNLPLRDPVQTSQIGREKLTAAELKQREAGKERLREIINRFVVVKTHHTINQE